MIAASALLIVTSVLVFRACHRRCVHIKRQGLKEQQSNEALTGTKYSSTDYPSSSYNSVLPTSTYGGTTRQGNQTEFAVPGFLKYELHQDFECGSMIAMGGGGKIFTGEALASSLSSVHGSRIVIKIVSNSKANATERLSKAFFQEVAVMHYLGRHRNIAVMLGWCEEPQAMLMKHYASGSLEYFIKQGNVQSTSMRIKFLLDISCTQRVLRTVI